MKKYIKILALVSLAGLVLAGCSKEPEIIKHWLKLSHDSFYFDAAGTESYTATVDSDPAEWNVETEGDWITAQKQDNSIVITVEPNTAQQGRQGKVIVTNEFTSEEIRIDQLSRQGSGTTYRPRFHLGSMVFSRSATMALSYDGSTATMINMATKEETRLPEIPYGYVPGHISDDGSVIIITHGDGEPAMYLENGVWRAVQAPDGHRWISIHSISADGSVWVGCSQNESMEYIPLKWTYGESEILKVPAEDLFGREIINEAIAYACSADGSIVCGSVRNWPSYAIYWTADGNWHYVAEELIELFPEYEEASIVIMNISEAKSISPNGKYIALTYEKISEEGGSFRIPLFFNFETGEYKLVESVTNGAGNAVSNEGVFFGCHFRDFGGAYEGYVYDFENETAIPTSQWIYDNYGLILEGDYIVDATYPGGAISGLKFNGIMLQPWYITTNGF